MDIYPERDIQVSGSPLLPSQFLQTILIAELLRPSRRLWICSPWISDVELLDNSARQFSSLDPDWPTATVRFSALLATLLERGATVVIVTDGSAHNDEFLERLAALNDAFPKNLSIIRSPNLRDEGIVGDNFVLDGSMNLANGGVSINDERLIYRCDPARVAERQLALESRWGSHLCS